MSDQRNVSASEFAAIAGMSMSTVLRWCKQGTALDEMGVLKVMRTNPRALKSARYTLVINEARLREWLARTAVPVDSIDEEACRG